MNSVLEHIKQNKYFTIFLFLLFSIIVLMEIIHQRFEMNDFKVYYLAGKSFFNKQNIYGIHFGLTSGYYKYSPLFLILISPYLLFPYKIACIIHAFSIAIFTFITFYVVQSIFNNSISNNKLQSNKLNFFVILILANHLFREIHLGNVNMLIVMLSGLSIYFTLKQKDIFSGFCFSLAIFIKPYLIILGIIFLVHKKFNTIKFAIFWGVIFFLIPMFFVGITEFGNLNQKWLHEIIQHGAYLYSNHTFTSLIRKYIFATLRADSHLYFLVGFVFLYFLITLIRRKSIFQNKSENSTFALSVFAFLALLPNILITDTEHFLYSTPIIYLLLCSISNKYTLNTLAIFILFSVLYGMNSTDIFGRELSAKIEEFGILGIANLGLLSLYFYIFRKQLF